MIHTKENQEFIKKYDFFLKNNRIDNFYECEQNKNVFKNLKEFIDKNIHNTCILLGVKGIGKSHLIGALIHTYLQKPISIIYIDCINFEDKYYEYSKLKKNFHEVLNWLFKHDLIIFDSLQISKNKKKLISNFSQIINRAKRENKKIIFIYSCKDYQLNNIPFELLSNLEKIIKMNELKIEDIKIIVNAFTKNYNQNIQFSEDAIDFLSETLENNTQILIDSLNQILFLLSNNKNSIHIIDKSKLKKIYEKLNINRKYKEIINSYNNEQIRLICKKLNINQKEIYLKTRKKDIVFKRNIIIYLLKEKLKIPHTKIGEIFSKSHSTISHSIKQIQKKLKEENFKKFLNNLIN